MTKYTFTLHNSFESKTWKDVTAKNMMAVLKNLGTQSDIFENLKKLSVKRIEK
jgi:hypothetical protein